MKITAKETTKLIDLILQMYPGISRQKAKKIIQYQSVLCDGVKIKAIPTTLIDEGSVVEVVKADPEKPQA